MGTPATLTQVPFLVTLYLSTLSWNVLRPGERRFIGLNNYGTVLTDARLRAALINTVVLTASAVIVSLILGLASRSCSTGSSSAGPWSAPC